jgi:FkbM family methyltransferase
MKKLGLLLLLAVAVIILSAFLWPKRIAFLVLQARGEVQVARGCSVFTPGIFDASERFIAMQDKVREVRREGRLALYETPMGPIWDRGGAWTLPALIQECQHDAYRLRSTVKPGDIVIDVGANIGLTAKTVLAAGAATVVALEPEPVILECLRRNLSAEIRQGRVVVIPKGAWDREDTLMLHVDETNAGGSSLVGKTGGPSIPVPLTTIDRVVADLRLPRVDLMKMDIEGAEKNALLGAAESIRRFHPRLAIVLEHNVSDVEVLPALVRQFWAGYSLTLTSCTQTLKLIHPETALLAP